MWNFLGGLFSIFIIPFMFINAFSGVVGAILLAIDGKWEIIGVGIAIAIIGPAAISIAMLPGMALSVPFISVFEKSGPVGKLISLPFLLLSLVWMVVLMAVWGYGVFNVLGEWNYYRGSDLGNVLWSYSAAIGPWAFLARKDSNNENTYVSLLFFSIACLFVSIGWFLRSETITMLAPITMFLLLVTTILHGIVLFAREWHS